MKVRPISIEELIQLIEQRPGITQAEVSDRYDIAPRTVRDVVQRANAHLAGAARIRLRRGRGYILEVIDRQAFEARCLRASKGAASLRTPDGRRLFLMAYLLIRDGWTALRDLSSVLYISRSVLSRDIARIKPRLASCGLTVVTRPRYGLRLEGSETLRRISLVSLVTEHGKTPDAPATLALAQAMAELSSLDTIYHAARTSMTEAMERRRIRVNPNVSETLYAHAYITAMRALQGGRTRRAMELAHSMRCDS